MPRRQRSLSHIQPGGVHNHAVTKKPSDKKTLETSLSTHQSDVHEITEPTNVPILRSLLMAEVNGDRSTTQTERLPLQISNTRTAYIPPKTTVQTDTCSTKPKTFNQHQTRTLQINQELEQTLQDTLPTDIQMHDTSSPHTRELLHSPKPDTHKSTQNKTAKFDTDSKPVSFNQHQTRTLPAGLKRTVTNKLPANIQMQETSFTHTGSISLKPKPDTHLSIQTNKQTKSDTYNTIPTILNQHQTSPLQADQILENTLPTDIHMQEISPSHNMIIPHTTDGDTHVPIQTNTQSEPKSVTLSTPTSSIYLLSQQFEDISDESNSPPTKNYLSDFLKETDIKQNKPDTTNRIRLDKSPDTLPDHPVNSFYVTTPGRALTTSITTITDSRSFVAVPGGSSESDASGVCYLNDPTAINTLEVGVDIDNLSLLGTHTDNNTRPSTTGTNTDIINNRHDSTR